MARSRTGVVASWFTDRVGHLVGGLASLGASGTRRAYGAMRPYVVALTALMLRGLKAVRQYRVGRYLSNAGGAFGAAAMARTAVVTGPLLGAMMYELLEPIYFALGLGDMRFLLLAMAISLGCLLRFYAYLGFFD